MPLSIITLKVVSYAINKNAAVTEKVDYRVRKISLGCLLGNNIKTLA
jgi:hypothetical protein